MLDRDIQATLNDLCFHWGEAYKITCEDGAWLAVPLSDLSVTISRDSSGKLREALRLDYAERGGCRPAGGCSL